MFCNIVAVCLCFSTITRKNVKLKEPTRTTTTTEEEKTFNLFTCAVIFPLHFLLWHSFNVKLLLVHKKQNTEKEIAQIEKKTRCLRRKCKIHLTPNKLIFSHFHSTVEHSSPPPYFYIIVIFFGFLLPLVRFKEEESNFYLESFFCDTLLAEWKTKQNEQQQQQKYKNPSVVYSSVCPSVCKSFSVFPQSPHILEIEYSRGLSQFVSN